jgi:hypothetical protein
MIDECARALGINKGPLAGATPLLFRAVRDRLHEMARASLSFVKEVPNDFEIMRAIMDAGYIVDLVDIMRDVELRGMAYWFASDWRVDVNAVYPNRYTPLAEAFLLRRTGVVKILLSGSQLTAATLNAASSGGYTRLALPFYYGDTEVIKMLLADSRLTAETLNTRDSDGNTPLTLAVDRGEVEIVRMLVDDPRVDVNLGRGGMAPVEMAIRGPLNGIARMLLSCPRVDVNMTSYFTLSTLLHVAVEESNLPVLRMLLADTRITFQTLNARDRNQKTALDLAKDKGLSEIVRLFRECMDRELDAEEESLPGFAPLGCSLQ